MAPGVGKTEKLYDFFEIFDRYIIKEKSIEHTLHEVQTPGECTSLSKTWGKKSGNEVMAKSICDIFMRIYNELKNGNTDYKNDSNYKKDFAFLNYWANWKIQGAFNQNTSVKDFNDSLEGQRLIDANLDIDNPLIYDIEKNDLYKRKILYSLYENYSKLNDIIENKFDEYKQSLSTLSTACCPEYNQASYICNGDNKNNNPIFCKKIEDFELKYQELHGKVAEKGSDYSKIFIKLKECPDNKIITTAVTGSIVGLVPLLGGLYKFTPMGQMFRSKIGMLNNDISNNDDEMTNISLMEQ